MLKIYKKEEYASLLKVLKERSRDDGRYEVVVREIINDVRDNGDAAVKRYCEKFDGVAPDKLYMSEAEKAEIIAKVPPELRATIERAAANIRAFHEKQMQRGYIDSSDGRVMGQRVLPLNRVGLYVPGGSAAYPSSVLMNAIPASVAGVHEIIMATPPKRDGINPAVIYAASVAGVEKILTVGGAQAIAALAFGTESVPQVDKIVGPGNIFVATAKRLVYGQVDIDMIAGPSEVLVICDGSVEPAYIAADLMSQAEHDPLAASVLISTSDEYICKVDKEIERQLATLSRRDIIERSLSSFGSAIVCEDLTAAAKLSDTIAPEHLELAVQDPFSLLGLVHNAGSVFLGANTPEPLGDYMAGPNHVLPTGGTARFSSPLSVDSFIKKSSYLYFGKSAFDAIADDVEHFALSEGLDAHANSVRVRK